MKKVIRLFLIITVLVGCSNRKFEKIVRMDMFSVNYSVEYDNDNTYLLDLSSFRLKSIDMSTNRIIWDIDLYNTILKVPGVGHYNYPNNLGCSLMQFEDMLLILSKNYIFAFDKKTGNLKEEIQILEDSEFTYFSFSKADIQENSIIIYVTNGLTKTGIFNNYYTYLVKADDISVSDIMLKEKLKHYILFGNIYVKDDIVYGLSFHRNNYYLMLYRKQSLEMVKKIRIRTEYSYKHINLVKLNDDILIITPEQIQKVTDSKELSLVKNLNLSTSYYIVQSSQKICIIDEERRTLCTIGEELRIINNAQKLFESLVKYKGEKYFHDDYFLIDNKKMILAYNIKNEKIAKIAKNDSKSDLILLGNRFYIIKNNLLKKLNIDTAFK